MQGFGMGRYVPPDLEGTTSFNVASGKGHALGARARKLKTEGILVVRFECPFAIWCTNCQPEQIIGQGVRFNAEKKKVGNYYSTPIWSFRFKHTVCGKSIEVRTDPQNAEYVVVEGGRRRDTGVDKLLDGEIRIGVSEEDKERLEKDGGFGVLEKKLEDKRVADTQQKRIDQLTQRSDKDWSDPYEMSRRLRREFRVGRRQRQADQKSGQALQDKFGIGLDLVAPAEEDTQKAMLIDFGQVEVGSVSSKPMFAEGAPVATTLKNDNEDRRGKKGTDKLAAHKGSLRAALKNNTRDAIDPFSSNTTHEEQDWRPAIKRQRVDEIVNESDASGPGDKHGAAMMPVKKVLVSYDSDSS